MKLFSLLLCLSVLSACTTAPTVGRESREWLNLQKGGTAASSTTPAMSGEVADKVHQRYVDSFGQPLPQTFEREKFTESGQGGSGGGG